MDGIALPGFTASNTSIARLEDLLLSLIQDAHNAIAVNSTAECVTGTVDPAWPGAALCNYLSPILWVSAGFLMASVVFIFSIAIFCCGRYCCDACGKVEPTQQYTARQKTGWGVAFLIFGAITVIGMGIGFGGVVPIGSDVDDLTSRMSYLLAKTSTFSSNVTLVVEYLKHTYTSQLVYIANSLDTSIITNSEQLLAMRSLAIAETSLQGLISNITHFGGDPKVATDAKESVMSTSDSVLSIHIPQYTYSPAVIHKIVNATIYDQYEKVEPILVTATNISADGQAFIDAFFTPTVRTVTTIILIIVATLFLFLTATFVLGFLGLMLKRTTLWWTVFNVSWLFCLCSLLACSWIFPAEHISNDMHGAFSRPVQLFSTLAPAISPTVERQLGNATSACLEEGDGNLLEALDVKVSSFLYGVYGYMNLTELEFALNNASSICEEVKARANELAAKASMLDLSQFGCGDVQTPLCIYLNTTLPAVKSNSNTAVNKALSFAYSLEYLNDTAVVAIANAIVNLKSANALLEEAGNCSWLHEGYFNTVDSMAPLSAHLVVTAVGCMFVSFGTIFVVWIAVKASKLHSTDAMLYQIEIDSKPFRLDDMPAPEISIIVRRKKPRRNRASGGIEVGESESGEGRPLLDPASSLPSQGLTESAIPTTNSATSVSFGGAGGRLSE